MSTARLAMVALAALSACSDAKTDDGLDPLTAYEPDSTSAAQPILTEDDVADSIQYVIDRFLGLSASSLISGFDAMDQDAKCPQVDMYGESEVWSGGCTTESGTTWEGDGTWWQYEDRAVSGGYLASGVELFCVGSITKSNGVSWSGVGKARAYRGAHASKMPVWVSVVQGSFEFSTAQKGSWLAEGLVPDLSLEAYLSTDKDARMMVAVGGVSNLPLLGHAVFLEDFMIFQEGLGSECEEEPAGLVSVRDTDGRWYVVTFDGDSDDENDDNVAEGACDGCGLVTFQDEPLGEVCVDWTVLYDWDGSPW